MRDECDGGLGRKTKVLTGKTKVLRVFPVSTLEKTLSTFVFRGVRMILPVGDAGNKKRRKMPEISSEKTTFANAYNA